MVDSDRGAHLLINTGLQAGDCPLGDGHQPFQRLNLDADVRAFLLPLLAPSNLGNLEP